MAATRGASPGEAEGHTPLSGPSGSRDVEHDGRYRVLSLCGGGYLGLYTAQVLERLEAPLLGASVNEGCLHRSFRLICGTSLGGLIALALAYRVPARDVAKALREHGKRIFPAERPCRRRVRWLRAVLRPAYDGEALKAAIDAVLPGDPRLGDLSVAVKIPAVNLADATVRVFHGGPGQDGFPAPDEDVRAKDVALATSAAPVYLPAVRIDGVAYADGGLVANAPDLIAACHAIEECGRAPGSSVRVLSVGTTREQIGFPARAGDRLGVWGWARKMRLLKVPMAGQMDLSRRLTAQLIGDHGSNRYHTVIDIPTDSRVSKYLGLDISDERADAEIEQLVGATEQSMDFAVIREEWLD